MSHRCNDNKDSDSDYHIKNQVFVPDWKSYTGRQSHKRWETLQEHIWITVHIVSLSKK